MSFSSKNRRHHSRQFDVLPYCFESLLRENPNELAKTDLYPLKTETSSRETDIEGNPLILAAEAITLRP